MNDIKTILDKVVSALADVSGIQAIVLGGSRSLPNELLVKIMKDQKQRADFLDFCHQFDLFILRELM